MSFFRKPNFKEIIGCLSSSTEEVIVGSLFFVSPGFEQGPSFVVEGQFDGIDPGQLLVGVASKANLYRDQLTALNAYMEESLKRLPEEARSWKIDRGNSIFSFYARYFPKEEMIVDQMTAMPFYADGVPGNLPRSIDFATWDPWYNKPVWQLCYDVFCDDVPTYSREERFRIEEAFSYVNMLGNISLQNSTSGDVLMDAKDDIIAESREVGARAGYYENNRLFNASLENESDGNVSLIEVLRKELHLVFPTVRISYFLDSEASGKPSAIIRVFKFDDEHLLVVFQFCPKLVKLQTSTDSSVSKVERKPFWKKLFKV
ncbi:MAG: hypothetical protein IJK70_00575 [Bacteroidales bacterium]|nr:hypothetical protein [Bacteroidales bacterium]